MEAHTKNELVSEYKRRMTYYKGNEIQRNFSKYAESGAVLYVFSNEYIKGYGSEKYGEILCPSC